VWQRTKPVVGVLRVHREDNERTIVKEVASLKVKLTLSAMALVWVITIPIFPGQVIA